MGKNEGWLSGEAAKQYIKMIDTAVPYRKDILLTIANIATTFAPRSPKILDIGCGHGDVTAEILNLEPQASMYMIDFSDEMIKLSKERFKDNNFNILQYDLNNGIPPVIESNKFDAIVSCFALHHIEFENRIPLYSSIIKLLKKNGLFINGDLFISDSITLEQWEFDNWIKYRQLQTKEKLGIDIPYEEMKAKQIESNKRMGDKPGTIWDMKKDLEQAGFRYVDCPWKYQKFAIIVATNI
jgi:tRNA (cmo5U34)-methyltransferase